MEKYFCLGSSLDTFLLDLSWGIDLTHLTACGGTVNQQLKGSCCFSCRMVNEVAHEQVKAQDTCLETQNRQCCKFIGRANFSV